MAKLEQLVERWDAFAADLRARDRVSQRFERDIADAYAQCAAELSAIVTSETGAGHG